MSRSWPQFCVISAIVFFQFSFIFAVGRRRVHRTAARRASRRYATRGARISRIVVGVLVLEWGCVPSPGRPPGCDDAVNLIPRVIFLTAAPTTPPTPSTSPSSSTRATLQPRRVRRVTHSSDTKPRRARACGARGFEKNRPLILKPARRPLLSFCIVTTERATRGKEGGERRIRRPISRAAARCQGLTRRLPALPGDAASEA